MIRMAFACIAIAVVTVPLGLIAVLGPLVRAPDRFYDRLARWWSGAALRSAGVRVRTEGLQHIPREQAVVFVSDHQSWIDVPALAVTVPQRYRFIAKQELRKVPLWGRAWQAAGHIAIDRTDTQAAIRTLEHAGRIIRADNSAVIMFPEGTRSPSDEMLPFKKGAFKLAQQLDVPIVPVAIIGSRALLPRDSWHLRSGQIIVRFGPPVPPSRFGPERTEELMAHVRTTIETLRARRNVTAEDEHGDHFEHTRA